MSRIFKYQTYVRILLNTGVELDSTVLDTRIYYKKPVSGTLDYVDAEIYDDQKLKYDIEADSSGNDDFFDEEGKWRFWTWVEFADGRTARGETVLEYIYNNEDAC